MHHGVQILLPYKLKFPSLDARKQTRPKGVASEIAVGVRGQAQFVVEDINLLDVPAELTQVKPEPIGAIGGPREEMQHLETA